VAGTPHSLALANMPVDFQLITLREINFQIRAAHARGKDEMILGKRNSKLK
jgi:hypothetical protein